MADLGKLTTHLSVLETKRADRILKKMDEDGISDKKMRKTVEKVKSESAPKMKECAS